MLDFYENNKESNCTYPGFGIRNEPTYFCAYCFNNIITRASSPNRCPPIITEETLMVNITGSPDLVPALFTPGFLQEDGTLTHNDMITKSKPIDIVRSDTGEAGKCVVITDWHHTIYNLFTAEQLGQLFEKHNFITLELLNIDFMGLKMPDGPQRLIDSKAGVVVKKP